ncbi:MAG TPA: DUF1972 domain-containing protein [Chitinophagaceae bacterium]
MKIGIIGTRGIPNRYGGFEQFAEHFSVRMAARGHSVAVYTSHRHPYKADQYKGVQLIRCYDPERVAGTAGQFLYDLNCIRNSRGRHFDIILQLGYTSSTVWSWLYPASSILATNMDGLEWSRAKYNSLTRYFLQFAEQWGVRYSHYLIADSTAIQEYLLRKYNAPSAYVAYGADVYEPEAEAEKILSDYSLTAGDYDLWIARFEPENSIEQLLKAYPRGYDRKLALVGNYRHTALGRRLFKQYRSATNIRFMGAIYDQRQLNTLRYYSRLYIHGHTAGGTNPSLLEAMGCSALIVARDNLFNRRVSGDDAFYFKGIPDLHSLLSTEINKADYGHWQNNNRKKIENNYNWEYITEKIESLFLQWKYEKETDVCLAKPV